jgi:hypothetical protein
MFVKMFHTVYNSYESKPNGRDYIGKHTAENPYDDYRGSFKDESFDPDSKIIMAYSKTAEGAVWFEINFHNVFDVARDPQYANQTKQTSTKFDTTGFSHTEKTKQKLKKARVGKVATKETKQKMREAHLGKTPTEETKQKMREASTGRKHTEEAKQKCKEARTGKTHTEEAKKKMSEAKKGEKHNGFGTRRTDETKQKIRNSLLGDNNPNFNKKWYVNTSGETCFCKEPPGPEWRQGRK